MTEVETGSEMTTRDFGTNTINQPQVGLFNLQQKKKPYDVKIKNFNPKEPKIKQNVKYSAKQNFRRYKSNIEPNLRSKIMVDEEDDMVNKIKKAFGMESTPNRNFTQTETSALSSQGLEPINPQYAEDESRYLRLEKIMIDIAKTGKSKLESEEMDKDAIDEWGKKELEKYGITESDIEGVKQRVQKREKETSAKKIRSIIDRINKEGTGVMDTLDQSNFDLDEWADIEFAAFKKGKQEEVFGEITAKDMDEILNEPIDLLKPPGEEGEDDDEGIYGAEEEDPVSPVSRGALTELSALSTEVITAEDIERAREERMLKRGVGRPKKPETIEKERLKAEKLEEKKLQELLKKAKEKEEERKALEEEFYKAKKSNKDKAQLSLKQIIALRRGFSLE
jgi:hypothetical protein